MPDIEKPSAIFGISLTAFLECLQLFGADSTRERSGNGGVGPSGIGIGGVTSSLARGGLTSVFDQQILRISGTCKLLWEGMGHPLIVM